MSDNTIVLNGRALTRKCLVAVANGASVSLDPNALKQVERTAEFLREQVKKQEPIYGVSTGFGSNADRLLGAHPLRDALPGSKPSTTSLHEELQTNLIITHAVCVGEPLAQNIVRAMLCIRINTLLCGHSGIRAQTIEALADLLNAGIVPVVPELGSVGASGDLAPLSHLAIVLLGGGEAFYQGQRMSGADALAAAGLSPITLTYKEGLALNNGTAQMLATGVLALDAMETVIDMADLSAAMTIDAFAGRLGAFDADVHALRPHPGQIDTAAHLRELLHGSHLSNIAYHLVPKFKSWLPNAWTLPDLQQLSFDISWDWVPATQRHGREKFYQRFRPFRGGKKHQPQDSYSLRCIPQVHGAVRDAMAQVARVLDVELNAVTDNPLVFPDKKADYVEEQVISAGHFHGMPLALVMSYLKAAIPVLAGISERRLNKLVDPATNDGLPAFLIGNEDSTESGFMIIQYTAAAIVNDLATRAHPASVYSIPTSANAEDHVSMGTNEARHVLSMIGDLAKVIGLELMTAAQALDYRLSMINAARELAQQCELDAFMSKIQGAPMHASEHWQQFHDEVQALYQELKQSAAYTPSSKIQHAHAEIRRTISFMDKDRALDRDVQNAIALVDNELLRKIARREPTS